MSLSQTVNRLCSEPPFRLIARAILKCFPVSLLVRDILEISSRPMYRTGIYAAALQAKRQQVRETHDVAALNQLASLPKGVREL